MTAALLVALALGPAAPDSDEVGEKPAWLEGVESWDEAPPSQEPSPEPTPLPEGDDAPPSWLEDVETWDPQADGEPEPSEVPAAREEPVPPERTGTVTGAIRLVGAFLRQRPDVRELGVEDDGLLAVVGRIIATQEVSERVEFEFNAFVDLSRAPSNLGGTFATTGSFETPYRAPGLTFALWDGNGLQGQVGIDRARVHVDAGPVALDVGRFPVNYATTTLFTVNDVFAPFSATAINRAFKPGVDAVRAGGSIGRNGALEGTAVLGTDEHGRVAWGRSAMLLRPSVVALEFEWSAIGGKVAERWIVGGGLQGDLGRVGIRAEGHLGVPDRDGDGHDQAEPLHGRVAAGPNLNFAWRSSTIALEYAYLSDGAQTPSGYLAHFGERFPDDLPYLGQHYVGANTGAEFTPLLRGVAVAIVNAADGSGTAGAFLSYSLADEADLALGAYVPWGASLTPTALRSEFGASPLVIFLQTQAYF